MEALASSAVAPTCFCELELRRRHAQKKWLALSGLPFVCDAVAAAPVLSQTVVMTTVERGEPVWSPSQLRSLLRLSDVPSPVRITGLRANPRRGRELLDLSFVFWDTNWRVFEFAHGIGSLLFETFREACPSNGSRVRHLWGPGGISGANFVFS